MLKKNTIYYLIYGKKLGKQEGGIYYCFERNEWVRDEKNLITDYLMGYDPCEPDYSPYKTGNLDIIDKIETIPLEKAIQIQNEQLLAFLKERWNKELAPKKQEWDEGPGWPAKLVKTSFNLNGLEYTLNSVDLGYTDSGFDQGFMESVQGYLKYELEAAGATDVYNEGFLD